MRILILHSVYSSGSVSGENRVVEDEARLLLEAGHEVHTWLPTNDVGRGFLPMARAGISAIWSSHAERHVRGLIRSQRPDVVHVHNLFPGLSPAVLRVARAEHATVVATLHNYRLLCLPATLYRGGQVCERCVRHLPWQGVRFGCYRDSHSASAALCMALGLHRALGTFDSVHHYFAISRFVRDQHVRAGLGGQRIHVKPNFSWPAKRRSGAGSGFLYAGRISREKGIVNLAKEWRSSFGTLLIVGNGPDTALLARAAPKGVDFLGAVDSATVEALISRSKAVVVPSLWNEPAGRIVLEAYAAGVPVIASRVGALDEFVRDGETGILADPGDYAAWASAIERLLDYRESVRMGDAAYRLWESHYSPVRGLKALEDAYLCAKSGEVHYAM